MLCRDTNAQKWPPTVRFHEVVSAVIGLVRRGNREVLWVPTNVNLGNFLYHWLRAFKDQEAGLETLALTTPAMLPWLDHIPEARRLVIDPSQVRFIDRRVLGMLQDWNVDYGREELHRFVREILLPSGLATITHTRFTGRSTHSIRSTTCTGHLKRVMSLMATSHESMWSQTTSRGANKTWPG